jgi:hypothetical protein
VGCDGGTQVHLHGPRKQRRTLEIAGVIAVGFFVLLLFSPLSSALSPGESLVGAWRYQGEPELLVEISTSAGNYTVTALEDTHVANSSCPLAAGTVLEKFSESGGGYSGQAALWNTSTCAFLEWATLEYEWEGEQLVGTIAGVCGFGCGPTLVRARPLVTGTSATAKEVSATVSGAIDPMRQATSYRVAFDLAGSGWCTSPGGGGASGTSGTESLSFTDHDAHAVVVSLGGLAPATKYCARMIATNPAGTGEGALVFFTTTSAAPPQLPNRPPASPKPPSVKITSHPEKETTATIASFGFTGVSGGTYQCSIDGGAWKACKSGVSFGPLQPGDHRFEVRETLNGLTGPAAAYSWTIDLPRACILKVARARVFAFTHQNKARLVIHYKAYKPAQVSVAFSLVGPNGSLRLGTASAHFKTAGIFRRGEKLDRFAVSKLRAAGSMTVLFSIPKAPTRCSRYYTKRLTVPKKILGQTVWFQSDSLFGPEAG